MTEVTRPETSAKRPTLKWYWTVPGLLLLGFGAFMLLMPVWDSLGVESVRCQVDSAEARKSSGGSRGAASTAGVMVRTTDCGDIYVSTGVSFDNRDEVAASFKPGTQYEFDIGWFSREITQGIRHEAPSVQAYRLAK